MKQNKQEVSASGERDESEFNIDWARLGIAVAGMVAIILLTNFYC